MKKLLGRIQSLIGKPPEAQRDSERRRYRRIEVILKIDYSSPQLGYGYATDVGAGGIFICTNAGFQSGEEIHFSISFPGLLTAIPIGGRVRWQRSADPKFPSIEPGVGVEFTHSSDEERHAVSELLERLEQSETVTPRNAPFRILLVEGEPFIQEIFGSASSGLPDLDTVFEISAANDTRKAVEVADSNKLDLIIVEHNHHDGTARELARQIREIQLNQNVPILAVDTEPHRYETVIPDSGIDLLLNRAVVSRQLVSTLRALAH